MNLSFSSDKQFLPYSRCYAACTLNKQPCNTFWKPFSRNKFLKIIPIHIFSCIFKFAYPRFNARTFSVRRTVALFLRHASRKVRLNSVLALPISSCTVVSSTTISSTIWTWLLLVDLFFDLLILLWLFNFFRVPNLNLKKRQKIRY